MTPDIIFGYAIFSIGSLSVGMVAGKEGGFLNMFDIDESSKKSIRMFFKKIKESFLGKDSETNTDTYTQHTPEVIKKDSLSAK